MSHINFLSKKHGTIMLITLFLVLVISIGISFATSKDCDNRRKAAVKELNFAQKARKGALWSLQELERISELYEVAQCDSLFDESPLLEHEILCTVLEWRMIRSSQLANETISDLEIAHSKFNTIVESMDVRGCFEEESVSFDNPSTQEEGDITVWYTYENLCGWKMRGGLTSAEATTFEAKVKKGMKDGCDYWKQGSQACDQYNSLKFARQKKMPPPIEPCDKKDRN